MSVTQEAPTVVGKDSTRTSAPVLGGIDPAGGDLVALVLTSPPCGPSLHGRITARPGQSSAKAHHQYSTDPANLAHVGLAGLLDDADHPCRLRLPAPPGRCRGAVPPRPGLRPTAATRRGTGPSNSELQPADSRICQGLTLRCAWRSPPTSTISWSSSSAFVSARRSATSSSLRRMSAPPATEEASQSRSSVARRPGSHPGEWVIYLPDRHVCPRDIVAGADARPGSAALTMRPWWPDTGVMTAESPPAVAPESPLMSLPGAVVADGVDAGVAAHYGNPLGEQRRLAEDVAFVDRSSRGVIRVPGTDRLSWLHSLTTQHLSALPAGRGTEALVLSPHGHIEHHLIVADDGEITWLDVEPGTAPALLTFLDAMRFLLRVDPRDATADWAVLTVGGPATDSVLRAALEVMVGSTPYDVTPLPGGGLVRRRAGASRR